MGAAVSVLLALIARIDFLSISLNVVKQNKRVKERKEVVLLAIDNNRHHCCTALTFGPPATPG